VLHSNFGCCIGTTKKLATYKISGAVERRVVPIRELVEKKRRRQNSGVIASFAEYALKAYPKPAHTEKEVLINNDEFRVSGARV
jgi:hypothetical protein